MASARVQLFPAGRFRALDGRPQEVDAWIVDDAVASSLIESAYSRRTPFVLDYEHQSLSAASEGIKAPAAAWFKSLEWSPTDGLFATDVEWTDAARALVEADEYRYISPVFTWDRASGRITGLINAALTNSPGLDGMAAVADLIAARLSTESAALIANTTQEDTMDDDLLERLRWFLNLPITATATDIAAELQKLIGQLGMPEGQATAPATWIVDHLGALKAELAEAKADALAEASRLATDSPTVPLSVHAALQGEIARLNAQLAERDRADLLDAALSDGRILPATEPYWREAPIEALRKYLALAQPVAALSGRQTDAIAEQKAASAERKRRGFSAPDGYSPDPERLELHERATEYAAAHGVTYAAAVSALTAEFPA